MSNHAKKREKHRLKRLKKQRESRNDAMTPLQRLAKQGGKLDCRINVGWEKEGIANVVVYGTTADGRHALGVFLVDAWCVGLKDAWGRVQILRDDFDELFKQWEDRLPMQRISADHARRLVAGAIRFSRQIGFKLPSGWEKWAKIFGELGDVASADLSAFGKDGGVFYVGNERFLRDRLIGCTPQEFFARPGVHYMMKVSGSTVVSDEDADFDEYDEDDEDESEEQLEEGDEEVAQEAFAEVNKLVNDWVYILATKTSNWCHAHGIGLHPLSGRAAGYLAPAIVRSALGPHDPNMPVDSEQRVFSFMISLMDQAEETDQDGIVQAFGQICQAWALEGIPHFFQGRAPKKEESPAAHAAEPMPREYDMPVPGGNKEDAPAMQEAGARHSGASPSPAEDPQHV